MKVRGISWYRNQDDLDHEDRINVYSRHDKYIIYMFRGGGPWITRSVIVRYEYAKYNHVIIQNKELFESIYLEWKAKNAG